MEHKLRKEAESILSGKFNLAELAGKSLDELIHELKVHQIELELQNEELLKTQEKLSSSQQKYFELFDLAPVSYLLVDNETRITEINLTGSQLLQNPRQNLINKRFNTLIHPGFQDRFYLYFKDLESTSSELVHESCLLINNNTVFVKISGNTGHDTSPSKPKNIRLAIIDITTEKMALAELETVKQRLELSLMAGNVAWWVWDYPTQMVYYDRKKAEMLGYEDGCMTQNVYEITAMIHPEDYERTMENMRSHIEGKRSQYQLEYRLKTKQGGYKWFYDQGSVTQHSADGMPLKICGVVVDITDKKIAELQHKESENRFRQFAALLPQIVCELDADFNILYINDFGKNILGTNESEVPNILNHVDQQSRNLVKERLVKQAESPGSADSGIEIQLKKTDGSFTTFFFYATLGQTDGVINTIRAIGIDISDRIKMEQHLSALNEELNVQKSQLEEFSQALETKVKEEVEKNRIKDSLMSLQARQAAMGEMVGHIAHQWKQPLNTLNLIVIDLQDAFLYNELTNEYMDKSVESAKNVINHMAQTIDDFRNFFKPHKVKTRFDVHQQIENALSFIRATIEIAAIRLENKVEHNIFTTGFPNEFSQVVINIVNNAREALLEHQPSHPIIEILSETTNRQIKLYFRNNGGKIPATIINSIFEPYFTTKESSCGAGISLYLVRTIIQQNMEGEISVKNTSDGVEFVITLPKSEK